MSEEVKIKSNEFWVKSFESLQYHWAVIEEDDGGECNVYFINTPPTLEELKELAIQINRSDYAPEDYAPEYPSEKGIFDQMSFPDAEKARAALERNRFKIAPEVGKVDEGKYGTRPSPPFHFIDYFWGSGYSSRQLYWEEEDGSYVKPRYNTETVAGSKGCLIILLPIVSALCLLGLGAYCSY